MSSSSFYWIGDPRIVEISSWREDIAWYCGTVEEDLDLIEASWGGPDGDENSVELITKNGEPVGTLDFMITQDDLASIVLTPANQRRSIEIRDVVKPSQAAPPSLGEKKPKPLKKRRRRKRDLNQQELLLPIAGGGAANSVDKAREANAPRKQVA
jgi:hypothetical protein